MQGIYPVAFEAAMGNPTGAKACIIAAINGTTEVMPYPQPIMTYSNPENALTRRCGSIMEAILSPALCSSRDV